MINYYYRSVRDPHIKEIHKPRKGAWVNIVTSSVEEVEEYANILGLDGNLLRDGIDLYESPRIERENGSIYIFIRYNEPSGKATSTQPLLIVSSGEFITTISRKPVPEIESILLDIDTVTTQKLKLILRILEKVNKGYRVYINDVTKQIFATRSRLAKTIIKNDDVLGFIDTEEALNEFLAALQPYGILLHALTTGRYFALHEDDKDLIEDIELSTNELIDLSKSRLKTMQNIREAYTTIATNNLNKIFKRLTSITIFLMIPTLISGLYGMNIDLPGANNPLAFISVVVATFLMIGLTMLVFKRKNWL